MRQSVTEIDAIYYMVSSLFGFPMSLVICTHCSWPHLDKDWFSVHLHRRHLCNGCGKHFYDQVTGDRQSDRGCSRGVRV